jgi:uncharacterized membrane protein YeaQ/YmgE (transglycosylase-associated protein family)
MHWIWLIIVGAVVGALGRLLHPGKDPMGLLLTIVIGIVSLLVAGALVGTGVWGFVVGVVAAIVLVAIVGRFLPEKRTLASRF